MSCGIDQLADDILLVLDELDRLRVRVVQLEDAIRTHRKADAKYDTKQGALIEVYDAGEMDAKAFSRGTAAAFVERKAADERLWSVLADTEATADE